METPVTYPCHSCYEQNIPSDKLFDKYQTFNDGVICPFPQFTSSKCEECMKKHLGLDVVKYYDFIPCSDVTKYVFGTALFKPEVCGNLSEITLYQCLDTRINDYK